MRKRFAPIMILISLLTLFTAHAQETNPEELVFSSLLPGGYAEEEITYNFHNPAPVKVDVSTSGFIKDWITLTQTSLITSESSPLKFKIIIRPPADLHVGTYEGFVLLDYFSAGNAVTSVTSVSRPIRIKVNITNREITEAEVIETEIMDIEQGFPVESGVLIHNKGNIVIKPTITTTILDLNNNHLLSTTEEGEIMPTVTTKVTSFSPHQLEPGQYRAQIAATLNGYLLKQEATIFNVFQGSTVRIVGELLEIRNNYVAVVNQTTPITAVFRNTGGLSVTAHLIADIYHDNEHVATIRSQAQNVGAGDTANLVAEFTPAAFGTYRITGHVDYNNKITPDKESFIDITAEGVPLAAGPLIIFIFFILIIIAAIIFRKKYRVVKRKRGA